MCVFVFKHVRLDRDQALQVLLGQKPRANVHRIIPQISDAQMRCLEWLWRFVPSGQVLLFILAALGAVLSENFWVCSGQPGPTTSALSGKSDLGSWSKDQS